MAVRGRKPLLPSPEALGPESVPARIRNDGACASGESVDIFDAAFDDERIEEARAICDICPVADICRQYAIDNEQHGVWGGTTPLERDIIRFEVMQHSPEERRRADELRAEIRSGRSREHIARDYNVTLRTLERWIRRDVARAAA